MLFILIISIMGANAQDRKSILKIADEHYYNFEYKQAASLYETLIKKDKAKTPLLRKLGDSYKQVNDYDNAAKWYKIIASRKDVTSADLLTYGDLLKNLGAYNQAKAVYGRYPDHDLLLVTNRTIGCDSAINWLGQATSDKIRNLFSVNTSASEWGAVTNSQKKIIFTSDSLRKTLSAKQLGKRNRMIDKRTNRSYFKLYQYDGSSTQSIGNITEFSAVLNNFDYHVGPVTFDKTESLVYFTVTSIRKINKRGNVGSNFYTTRRLEIFSSKLQNGKWEKPVPFPFNSDKFSVGHPALSADGEILYFASDMNGGQGKTDIWYCEKRTDGNWGNPVNCGPEINTTEEEEFPTVNNEVLYFSSAGHIGMGGFDIFSAAGSKKSWSAPQNLKSPLNSSGDDFYLCMQDNENGYFSSNRKGGRGDDDVYVFTKEKKVPNVEPPQVVVPAVFPKLEISTPKIELKKPKSGEKFVIYNDFDKSNVRSDASESLDSVVNLLIKYPDMRIRLSSYTDSRGKFDYNMALSKKRAKAAKDYLVKFGVSAQRIIANGYGATNLLVKCPTNRQCSEADHQKNRRTEVLVLPY